MNSKKYEQNGNINRKKNTAEKEIMEGLTNGKTGRKRDNQQTVTRRKRRAQQGRTKVTEMLGKEKATREERRQTRGKDSKRVGVAWDLA